MGRTQWPGRHQLLLYKKKKKDVLLLYIQYPPEGLRRGWHRWTVLSPSPHKLDATAQPRTPKLGIDSYQTHIRIHHSLGFETTYRIHPAPFISSKSPFHRLPSWTSGFSAMLLWWVFSMTHQNQLYLQQCPNAMILLKRFFHLGASRWAEWYQQSTRISMIFIVNHEYRI